MTRSTAARIIATVRSSPATHPVIPRLPHGFPILDDVQAAPLADGDNEGTRFRDERAKPCWFAFTGAWPAHSSIAFLLAASNAILMMFSNHARGA